MGDLTKNLSRNEFACKCGCGMDVPDFTMVNMIQSIADKLSFKYRCRVRVNILSGNRCRAHNEIVQKKYNPDYTPGSSRSFHMGRGGVDFNVEHIEGGHRMLVDSEIIYNMIDEKYPDTLGIILYDNRVHLDPRTKKYRGDKR